jgi:hypothetical protein
MMIDWSGGGKNARSSHPQQSAPRALVKDGLGSGNRFVSSARRPKKTWQEQDGAGRLYQDLEIPSPFCPLLPLWTCGEDSAAASFPMPEPGTAAAAAVVRTDIG